MCEVEDLSVKLRQRRLRWFGHVKSIGGGVGGGESWAMTASKKA